MGTQPVAVDMVKASMAVWEVLWPGTVDVMDHPDLGPERFKVRQVLDALISANVLRDVRDVQAEALEETADDIEPLGYGATVTNVLRARAQAIREARND